MTTEACAHAMRIWQLPPEQWRAELQALPVKQSLNGVMWPPRQAVIQRLLMAKQLEKGNCRLAGWPDRAYEG